MKIRALMLAASIATCAAATSMAASFPAPGKQVVSTDEQGMETLYASWLSGWTAVFNQVAGENNWTSRVIDGWGEKFLNIPDVTILYSYSTGRHGSEFMASFIYQGGYASYTAVPTAVPGPEAGAGLGALALGGMALWMNRRRKSSALAA